MEKEIDKNLEEVIVHIRSLNSAYNKLGLEMLGVHDGKMYPMDLFVVAVLNRAEHLVSAFCDLVEKKNFLVVAPVLRMQLDTLFRLRAAWLVENPSNLVIDVLRGNPIKELTDRNGKKMNDRYLVDSLCEEHPELKSIYERTCSYVHLSDQHFFTIVKKIGDDRTIEMKVNDSSDIIPIKTYLEASMAFFQISGIILSYIKGWIIAKEGNPL